MLPPLSDNEEAQALRETRRERRIRAQEPPHDAASSPARDEVFELGLPGKVGPVLLLAAGIGMTLLFGLASALAPNVVTLFLLGFGMMATGIGWALLFGRQTLVRLTVGPDGATLLASDRSSATIPHAALTGARVKEVRSTSTSSNGTTSTSVHYEIHLRKRDEGLITLGHRSKQAAADELATAIDASLALHRPPEPPTDSSDTPRSTDPTDNPAALTLAPTDPIALLRQCTMVQARREASAGVADYRTSAREGPLVLEWSLRPTSATVVPSILAPSGMGCALYGFYLHEAQTFILAIALFFFALVVFLVVRQLLDMGLVQRLRVSDDGLLVEKRRGDRPTQQHNLPLASITAVDFSHTQDGMGGVLAIRTDGSPSAAKLAEIAKQGAFSILRGILAHARDTVHIPLGRLPFGDKVRVDLAVGAEIARRSARDESTI